MNIPDTDRKETDGARQKLSALIDFGNLINSSLDLKFTLDNLLLTCFSKFHTMRGLVVIADKDGWLNVASFKGIQKKNADSFPRLSITCSIPENTSEAERFIKNASQLIVDNKYDDFIKDNKFAITVPLFSSKRLHGFLLLGERFGKADYTAEDLNFLSTIVNIASTAIENSLIVDELKSLNRNLDSKVSMLSSLFELSKEFSGILDVQHVCKLLGYTIMGQLLVSGYGIIICRDSNPEVLESKLPPKLLEDALRNCLPSQITAPLKKTEVRQMFPDLAVMGIELIIPMQIHAETKGLVLLGKRLNSSGYSSADIEFLYALASLAIVSIENSRLFKEALEKQKMEEDLEIARQIQRNLLPQSIPEISNFEIAALNITSKQVGGDYYDLIRLDQQNLLFAIGDVAGKGVPASLMMANMQAFLKSICKQGMRLDEATALLNDLISENTMIGSFITFFWGIIDNSSRAITYVNAGHNPPLLLREGKIQKLEKGGMILGVVKTIAPYLSETVTLDKGDILVLFTDGVTEAMNTRMEEFTDERLEELVPHLKDLSAQQAVDRIIAEVQGFTSGASQSDDITIMVIKAK